ncbi:hypothetical protein F511_28635 [Dorcoceras hygrometricum]|uniref:Uncharacterized protein n=1 Tax=Dorcoceras hygrometricum TaxID=472368 RepID=A0A2Z7BJE5_9LAMI|nr:hypothetical protein F511_28635 [Dorcoceras hygrometricum]
MNILRGCVLLQESVFRPIETSRCIYALISVVLSWSGVDWHTLMESTEDALGRSRPLRLLWPDMVAGGFSAPFFAVEDGRVAPVNLDDEPYLFSVGNAWVTPKFPMMLPHVAIDLFRLASSLGILSFLLPYMHFTCYRTCMSLHSIFHTHFVCCFMLISVMGFDPLLWGYFGFVVTITGYPGG